MNDRFPLLEANTKIPEDFWCLSEWSDIEAFNIWKRLILRDNVGKDVDLQALWIRYRANRSRELAVLVFIARRMQSRVRQILGDKNIAVRWGIWSMEDDFVRWTDGYLVFPQGSIWVDVTSNYRKLGRFYGGPRRILLRMEHKYIDDAARRLNAELEWIDITSEGKNWYSDWTNGVSLICKPVGSSGVMDHTIQCVTTLINGWQVTKPIIQDIRRLVYQRSSERHRGDQSDRSVAS